MSWSEIQKSILLVDAEPLISLGMAEVLSDNGWEVFTDNDARHAIENINNRPIDLILMDIDFGEGQMDGAEAARLILKDHDIPIVFYTNHTEKRFIDKLKGIRSYGFVTKDSGDFVLIQSVSAAFELFRTHAALEDKKADLEADMERLSRAELKAEEFLDGVPANGALLDDSGTILFVNKAWRQFAGQNGIQADRVSEGVNYLRVCDEARGASSAEAEIFAAAIREILAGKRDHFSMDYPCHSPDKKRWFSGKVTPLRLEGKQYTTVIHLDITEQKEIEELLRQTEADLRLAQQIGKIGSFKWYIPTDELWWSDETFAILGIEKQQPSFTLLLEAIHPDDYEQWERAVSASLEKKKPLIIDFRITKPNGEVVWVHNDTQLVLDEDGEPLELIGTVQDITERKEAEAEIARSRERYKLLFENANDAIIIYQDGRTVLYNPKALDITGYTAEEYTNLSIADLVHPDDQSLLHERYLKRIAGEIPDETYEYRLINRAGETRWICMNPTRIIWNGKPAVLGVGRDVTRRKMLEKKLQNALAEKEFLMQEIDHRVKNNLLMVSSLVKLKDREIGDSVDLSDLSRQIDTIRIVHQKLHQSAEVQHIDFREYAADLLESVISFSEIPVSMELEIEPIRFHPRTILPLGLIINEIATNAIKYGFVPGSEACFRVGLKCDYENQVHILTLANTGTPFPPHINLKTPRTLGLRLISVLVSQLKGTIELEREPHPQFTIRFPLPKG